MHSDQSIVLGFFFVFCFRRFVWGLIISSCPPPKNPLNVYSFLPPSQLLHCHGRNCHCNLWKGARSGSFVHPQVQVGSSLFRVQCALLVSRAQRVPVQVPPPVASCVALQAWKDPKRQNPEAQKTFKILQEDCSEHVYQEDNSHKTEILVWQNHVSVIVQWLLCGVEAFGLEPQEFLSTLGSGWSMTSKANS